MRLMWCVFWTGVAIIAASERLSAKRDASDPLTVLRARCPTTRNLAPEGFARSATAPVAQLDGWEQRIRGSLRPAGPPANAEVVLRAFAGPSITQNEPSETATTLWRQPDGSWHLVVVDHYPNRPISPPPPPAVLTSEQAEAAKHSVGEGRLDDAQATTLNALLADPCLDAEPDVVSGDLPLRPGVAPMQPCYDAVLQSVEVVRAGRRRVYSQTCRYFLAGELIGIALYPRARGEAAMNRTSQTLATVQSARHHADQMLASSADRAAWSNATDAAGSYVLLHRASGFRCATTEPAAAQVYGATWSDRAGDGGRCVRQSSVPAGGRRMQTEWRVDRRLTASDVRRRVGTTADDWLSAYFGSDARRPIRVRAATNHGIRFLRADVAGPPKIDAREDELSVVVGCEHDGWTVVVRATGSVLDRAAIEAAAFREWHDLIKTRTRPVG